MAKQEAGDIAKLPPLLRQNPPGTSENQGS